MSDGVVERLPEWEPANMVMDKLQMSLTQRLANEKREELAEVLQRVDKVIHRPMLLFVVATATAHVSMWIVNAFTFIYNYITIMHLLSNSWLAQSTNFKCSSLTSVIVH